MPNANYWGSLAEGKNNNNARYGAEWQTGSAPVLGAKFSRGSGLGNYTIAGVANVFISVDPTNLNAGQNFFVPKGYVAIVSVGGSVTSATAAVQVAVAIGVDGVAVLEQDITPNAASAFSPFGLTWIVQGDDNTHNFTLMANTSNTADVCTILNTNAINAPFLLVELTQSNLLGNQTYSASDAEGSNLLGASQKVGSGAGNFSMAFTSFQPVDGGGGQLTQTFLVPKGFSLIVSASGSIGVATAVPAGGVAVGLLVDGKLVVEQDVNPSATSALTGWGLQWTIVGDGNYHVVTIAAHTTAGADSVLIGNSSVTHAPIIVAELTQSNLVTTAMLASVSGAAVGGTQAGVNLMALINAGGNSYGASNNEGGGKLGVVQLLGNGLGNYATNSSSFVAVDTNNLQVSLMVPVGFVALITAAGTLGCSAASAVTVAAGIAVDGVMKAEVDVTTTATANRLIGWGAQYMLVGDGLAHTITMMFRSPTANGIMGNSNATHVPSLTVELTQSTF